MNPRGAGGWVAFIIFAVTAEAAIPGISPFHYPPLGQWPKARAPFRPVLHFDPPSRPMFREPGVQLMVAILAIAKDYAQARKLVHPDLREQLDGCYPIIECGARNQHDEDQPDRIHEHMTFAPFDLLAAVIPALLPPDFRRLHRLAVDTSCTGGWFAPFLDTDPGAEVPEDLGPRPLIAPLGKVFIHGTLGQQVMR